MSQSSQEPEQVAGTVLTLSAHDIRYFMTLLRGINFASRALVTLTKDGIVCSVEEARSVLATAWIFADVFDEFTFTPRSGARAPSLSLASTPASQSDSTMEIEIALGPFIEALNIFGSANAGTRKWKWQTPQGDGDDAPEGGGGRGGQAKMDAFLGPGKETGMRLSYRGDGYPLELLIAEEKKGPTARCEITTYDAEPQVDLALDVDNIALKIIMKSSLLHEALSELDTSYEKLTLIATPTAETRTAINGRPMRTASSKPVFRIHATGPFGSAEMDYPDDKEVLEKFECEERVSFSYRFAHLQHATRALGSSSKTSLRIDNQGVLSMQLLVPPLRRGAKECYIDFLCLPVDDDV